MASCNDTSVYPKISNILLEEKLKALKAQAENLDKLRPLKILPTDVSLSEAIGQKGAGPKEFYSKLEEKHKFSKWEALIDILCKEDRRLEPVEGVIDGLLAYAKSNQEIWMNLCHAMCHHNLDVACLYAMEELKDLQNAKYMSDFGKEILRNALDVIGKLQQEKSSLEHKLKNVRSDLDQNKEQLEECRKGREIQIKELEMEYNRVCYKFDEELKRAAKDREKSARDRKEAARDREQAEADRKDMREELGEIKEQRNQFREELQQAQKHNMMMAEMIQKMKQSKPSTPNTEKPAKRQPILTTRTIQLSARPNKQNKNTNKPTVLD